MCFNTYLLIEIMLYVSKLFAIYLEFKVLIAFLKNFSFIFLLYCVVCGILVSPPGIEPRLWHWK